MVSFKQKLDILHLNLNQLKTILSRTFITNIWYHTKSNNSIFWLNNNSESFFKWIKVWNWV